MSKKFEVWTEGHVASGGRGKAQYHGSIYAENFEEACINILEDNLDYPIQGIPTVWGCRCFDNETDARKSFG